MYTDQNRFQGTKQVKGLEYFSLSAALLHFRQEVEKGTGAPIQNVEVNACLFLDDIMKWIGMSEAKRAEVLGKSASVFVASVECEAIKPADETKH